MFQNLKKGSLVYVLDTREMPKFYTESVKEVGMPYYPQPSPGQLAPFQQQYINITIGDRAPWGIPVNTDVATNEGITISMTREGLMPTVTAAQKQSMDIVNSFEQHKNYLAAYENILQELDPSFAKTKKQDEEINRLNKEIAQLKDIMAKVPSLEDIEELFNKFDTIKKNK